MKSDSGQILRLKDLVNSCFPNLSILNLNLLKWLFKITFKIIIKNRIFPSKYDIDINLVKIQSQAFIFCANFKNKFRINQNETDAAGCPLEEKAQELKKI